MVKIGFIFGINDNGMVKCFKINQYWAAHKILRPIAFPEEAGRDKPEKRSDAGADFTAQ